MSTLIAVPSLGLGEIQRAALLQIADQLNTRLVEVQAAWEQDDAIFATALGRDPVVTEMEPVAPENFHDGHRPSLIKAPVEAYPNVSCMVQQASPHPGSASMDHSEIYRDLLWVEIMARSLRDEGEANRRLLRMVDAVNVCILSDVTLGGTVHGLDTAPTVRVGDMFPRKEQTAYGPTWFWQGARLEYVVRKESARPRIGQPSFRAANQFDIDQA